MVRFHTVGDVRVIDFRFNDVVRLLGASVLECVFCWKNHSKPILRNDEIVTSL